MDTSQLILILVILGSLSSAIAYSEPFLKEAIKHALTNSFQRITNYLTVTVQTASQESEINFLDLLDEILENEWNYQYQLNVNNDIGQSIGDFNLLFIDSFTSFRRLIPSIRAYGGDSSLFFLTVLNCSTVEESHDVMKSIFDEMFLWSLLDVSVLIQEKAEKVSVYTFFPYQESACGSTKPLEIYQMTSDNRSIGDLFPPKTINFHKCPLRVDTRNPTHFRQNYIYNGYLELWGLESELLNGLKQRMNFTTQFFKSSILEKAGISPNGTAYGPFKSLKDGRRDMVIGFFNHAPWRDQALTASLTYFTTYVVIGLYRPPYEYRKFSWLLIPFDGTVWLTLLVYFVITAICVLIAFRNPTFVKYFEIQPNRSKIINIFSAAITGGIEHLPSKSFLRICLMIWILGALIFRASYEGMLFDSYRRMSLPRTPLTVRQLLSQQYTIHLQELYIPMVYDLLGVETIKHEKLSRFVKLKNLPPKSAVIGSYTFFYMFYEQEELMKIVMEPLFVEQACIFLQQHSTMNRKINMIILEMEESGLLLRWRGHYDLMASMNFSPKRAITPNITPILLERFKYNIFLFAGFYVIACIVFVGEIVWVKIKDKKYFSNVQKQA